MPRWKASLLAILAIAGMIGVAPAEDLPPDVLAGLYRTGLGNRFNAVELPRLNAAHQLLERYFVSSSSEERSDIARQIDAVGLDRSIVGRIARLRTNWAALTPGVYYINDKAWPLVVKLPAANAFLTSPPPDAQQVSDIYSQWMTDELSAHPDAIVLMPLLNLDELYGPGPVGMNLVMQPIFDAAGKANVDPSRVYLIGHSMAAHAVWNIAIHYPTYFAAINPMAGSVSASWQ